MSKKNLSPEQKRANKKRADAAKQETFVPKSYKELVDWFCDEIVSGVGQKRDFLNKARTLRGKLEKAVKESKDDKPPPKN